MRVTRALLASSAVIAMALAARPATAGCDLGIVDVHCGSGASSVEISWTGACSNDCSFTVTEVLRRCTYESGWQSVATLVEDGPIESPFIDPSPRTCFATEWVYRFVFDVECDGIPTVEDSQDVPVDCP